MGENKPKIIPRSLRQSLSVDELVSDSPVDGVRALGSYWSRHDDADAQSRLVKYFKESYPDPQKKPYLSSIVHSYSNMLCSHARDLQPTALLRALSSGETKPDSNRPQSLLIRSISASLAIPDVTDILFRSEPRKPMRMFDQLSGSENLRRRIGYVLQDLFVRPQHIGGTMLVIDDIYNLGATARVYSAALKHFCGVEKVYSINLAAARFNRGIDGWRRLSLDIDRFSEIAKSVDPSDAFDTVWISKESAEYHLNPNCPHLQSGRKTLLFLARENRVPCPSCAVVEQPKRTIRSWLLGR